GGGLQGDANGVSGSIAGGAWKLLLGAICEVICEPSFPADKFARHKGRLLDRLLVERDDPRSQTGQLFRKLIYGDHWMGQTVYGSLESVERIQRKHLVAFHAKNWCPTRAVIAVCGDVDPEEVRKLFNRKLRTWKPKAKLSRPSLSFPDRAPRFDVFAADRQQVHVYFGHLGVCRDDPNYTALVVMDHILGTGPGFSNRISQKLRDQMGLAYTVHADIHSSAGAFPGMFTAYIGTSPQHLELALRGFIEEMHRICDELVLESELELAQNYLLGSYALGFERAARRSNYMISAERFGLPADHLSRLPDKFAAVTAEDIRSAARACLFPAQPCLVVGGPIKKSEVKSLFSKLLAGESKRRKSAN
ncbi:MAG: zinc protease, partial [Planctomycetota bacterium]